MKIEILLIFIAFLTGCAGGLDDPGTDPLPVIAESTSVGGCNIQFEKAHEEDASNLLLKLDGLWVNQTQSFELSEDYKIHISQEIYGPERNMRFLEFEFPDGACHSKLLMVSAGNQMHLWSIENTLTNKTPVDFIFSNNIFEKQPSDLYFKTSAP
ncbi:MAG: hypothetical protein R2827_09165 [Bdellovibrionales bacterium]